MIIQTDSIFTKFNEVSTQVGDKWEVYKGYR